MKRYNLTGILVLIILFASCEDELNLEPAQSISVETALSTSENIQNILIGTYAEAGQSDSYGGRLQMLSDLYGFTSQASWNGTFQQPREVFNKNILTDNSFIRDYWLNSYEVINQANLVIDHIDIVEAEVQSTVLGEAKFIRALAYFDLVRLFGSQYVAGQQNSQPGVPLSLEGIIDYSGDLELPRSSVEEVYIQVINDLNDAYGLLPATNSFFADKYSAQALLARVYLQQGDYAGARDTAHDVIENSGHALTGTYAAAFNNDVDSSEDLFAFQVTTQGGTNQLIVHYADQPNGGRGDDITVNDEYLAMFDSADDVRASFFYPSAQGGGRLTSKYTNQYGNITLVRLAEMYLIRAEANLNEGTFIGNSPVDDINEIRIRANAEALAAVTLDDILLERELELGFEGFLIHDLKRTGRAVGTIPSDDNKLIYPIPQREMDVNSLLEQNPGYGL
ncbi:RagB/SusD family nutrient uptake outer membrane protein [Galbibacter sp. EGI 63066]|uniref:RagB/SusD family nutrient uptake outer membrane protein n=1 Tax=Galbibacter sp. EGI 63066 TaxID=2993559 RepID=UPI002248E7E5|nr:RagB/SusD family nutrient uptake outer membrane protein [Galbibacter sp. EGI 63066]MCX2679442.1 RagB/SusD family nutrient uptake outer membrane protein [Galbibacter sp. EGI 63066]